MIHPTSHFATASATSVKPTPRTSPTATPTKKFTSSWSIIQIFFGNGDRIADSSMENPSQNTSHTIAPATNSGRASVAPIKAAKIFPADCIIGIWAGAA